MVTFEKWPGIKDALGKMATGCYSYENLLKTLNWFRSISKKNHEKDYALYKPANLEALVELYRHELTSIYAKIASFVLKSK